MTDLPPDVRDRAAQALYKWETQGPHDFGLEPAPWPTMPPEHRDYYLQQVDAVTSVLLSAGWTPPSSDTCPNCKSDRPELRHAFCTQLFHYPEGYRR